MTKRRKRKELKREATQISISKENPMLPGLLNLMRQGDIAVTIPYTLPKHVADGTD